MEKKVKHYLLLFDVNICFCIANRRQNEKNFNFYKFSVFSSNENANKFIVPTKTTTTKLTKKKNIPTYKFRLFTFMLQ